MMDQQSDYLKYRGKCRQMAEQAAREDPSLRVVCGYYICPFWGEQPHWWTVRPDGSIYDPTSAQFPSKGLGEYILWDGTLECEYCGKKVKPEEVYSYEHHVYCSYTCFGRDIM